MAATPGSVPMKAGCPVLVVPPGTDALEAACIRRSENAVGQAILGGVDGRDWRSPVFLAVRPPWP